MSETLTRAFRPALPKTPQNKIDRPLGLNPSSVKANLMPMLFLPPDLKDIIRQRGLKGAHALALATLSAKGLDIEEELAATERIAATNKVLKENLTVPETRELIKTIKDKYLKHKKSESKEVKAVIQKVKELSEDSLQGASSEQLQQLRVLLEQKLASLSKMLDA